MDLYAPLFSQLVSFFYPLLSLSPFFGTGCCYPAQPFFTLPSCLWPCPVRRGKADSCTYPSYSASLPSCFFFVSCSLLFVVHLITFIHLILVQFKQTKH
ncbi:hypothetical protein BKA57DRAFT_44417 [Linnemannia elongata]|nr:hypothetical protein BKA57DRAFT_44417 [Linnemannia elongata]